MHYTKINLTMQIAPDIVTNHDVYVGESETDITLATKDGDKYTIRAAASKCRTANITHKTAVTLIRAAEWRNVWYLHRTLCALFPVVTPLAHATVYPGVEDRVFGAYRFVISGRDITLTLTEAQTDPKVTFATQFGRVRVYPNLIVYENAVRPDIMRVSINVARRRWQFRPEWAGVVHLKEAVYAAQAIEDKIYTLANESSLPQQVKSRCTADKVEDFGTIDGVIYRFLDHTFIPGYESLKGIGLYIYAALDVIHMQLKQETPARAGSQERAIARYMTKVAELTLDPIQLDKKSFLITPL